MIPLLISEFFYMYGDLLKTSSALQVLCFGKVTDFHIIVRVGIIFDGWYHSEELLDGNEHSPDKSGLCIQKKEKD